MVIITPLKKRNSISPTNRKIIEIMGCFQLSLTRESSPSKVIRTETLNKPWQKIIHQFQEEIQILLNMITQTTPSFQAVSCQSHLQRQNKHQVLKLFLERKKPRRLNITISQTHRKPEPRKFKLSKNLIIMCPKQDYKNQSLNQKPSRKSQIRWRSRLDHIFQT